MPLSILPNPYLMAVFAAVAIGIVVYEVVTKKHQEKVSSGRPRPPKPPPPSGPSDSRKGGKRPKGPPTSPGGPNDSPTSPGEQKDPITSSTESSGYADGEVRKRNFSSKPDLSKDKVKKGLTETLPKKRKEQSDTDKLQSEDQKLSSNMYHQNVDKNNYEKNVYEKILNETKRMQDISKNISDEDSDSENNTSEKTNNFKASNMEDSDKPVYFSNGSNNLSQTSKEEEIYKKNISENIRCQEAMKEKKVLETPEAMEDENVLETQRGYDVPAINFNVTQGICSGCEDAPINTVAYPCGHGYLCSECATIIFRIHKTCSICLADIFEFRSM